MSVRSALILASVWIWGAVILGWAEEHLPIKYAMAAALFVGMASAVIAVGRAQRAAEKKYEAQP